MAKQDPGSVFFMSILFCWIGIFACNHCCKAFLDNVHAAENRALHGFAYSRASVRSRVICARDCSMDERCKSFNFNDCDKVCELNSATRRQHPEDFNITLGSVYFDKDEDTALNSAAGGEGCKVLHVGK